MKKLSRGANYIEFTSSKKLFFSTLIAIHVRTIATEIGENC